MGGQHGIGQRNNDSQIPPFLPVNVYYIYQSNTPKAVLDYLVNLNQHMLYITDFTVKSNGVPVVLTSAIILLNHKVYISGNVFDTWENPVTVSYDGTDPEFKSVTDVPCEEFTDFPAGVP